MNKFILIISLLPLFSCSKSKDPTPTDDSGWVTPADPAKLYSVKIGCADCTVSYDTKTSAGVKISEVKNTSLEIKGYFVKNTYISDVYDIHITNRTAASPSIDLVQPTGAYSVSYSFAPIDKETNSFRLIIRN